MVCKNCGKPIEEEWLFCYHCGTKLKETTAAEETPEADTVPEQTTAEPEQTEARPEQGKKPGKRKKLIIGVAAAAVLAVLGFFIFALNKYNTGVAKFESGEYEEAKGLFDKISWFKDAEDWSLRSQMEIDYNTIDSLADSGDYNRIVEILDERKEYYGSDDKGKEAEELSREYKAVSDAFELEKIEDYKSAIKKFESLNVLYDKYSRDMLLCSAYQEKLDSNWTGILVNLYAIQINDPRKEFIDNGTSDDDKLMAEAASQDTPGNVPSLLNVITTDDTETAELKKYAENGYKYDEAKDLAEMLEFEKAIEIYEELGDFMDSKDCLASTRDTFDSYENSYKQAGEYYNNGEFFKAKKEYASISAYKDAWLKATECVREMPANGYKKSGNGSGAVLMVKAPYEFASVYIKIYDESGELAGEMFIAGGNSVSINMKPGKYIIKSAVGTDWYGDIDLFGEMGVYQQMSDGGNKEFQFDRNYKYILTIGGVSNGNVGTNDIVGGADGM